MAGASTISSTLIILIICSFVSSSDAQGQAYVVYMGSSVGMAKGYLRYSHLQMLLSAVGSSKVARKSLIYSYTHSFNGFSAVLSEQQAQVIASMPGVVSVFPSRMHKLHTTRSWDFLRLQADYAEGSHESTLHAPVTGDVIIGIIDTGVWPELESFDDEGMGPIPSKWKGKCMEGENFNTSNCNRELIGARYYGDGFSMSMDPEANFRIYDGPTTNDINDLPRSIRTYASARDSVGHGSHTSTTAGGRLVDNASYYGLAKGVARGGAPLSRIAAYKVCFNDGHCSEADILAAFDDAIKDGVDVLYLSLGRSTNLLTDAVSIGAFHAVQNDIVVVCSAGNDGPYSYTVTNIAPWILTVAASTVDRFFDSKVVLGNNKTFDGQAVNYFNLSESSYPIVFGGDIAATGVSNISAGRCGSHSLNETETNGKIVLCLQGEVDETRKSKSSFIKSAGGVGMIIVDDTDKFEPSIYDLPATQVSQTSGLEILDYIRSTTEAIATILPAETVPDITAPGVNILAGWTTEIPYGDPPPGESPSHYAIASGTSMSCPHVSGTAALLRSVNPEWRASAIKSALMTTATTMDNANAHITNDTGSSSTAFDLGTGELNPVKALDPGLVYESDPKDHFLFLCYLGYNQTHIGIISGNKSFVCPLDSKPELISNLNYPSIAISKLNDTRSVVRTLTNVGPVDSTYTATVMPPPGVGVKVSPEKLVFSASQKSISINVQLKVTAAPSPSSVKNYVFGSLSFSDGTRSVVTPLVVNSVSV